MKTFADEAKQIKSKYYKDREPGEDKITDDSFNAEMKALVQAQEAIKQEQGVDNNQQQQLAKGGNLPKYYSGGTFTPYNPMNTQNLNINTDYSNFGQNAMYNPNQFSQQGFQGNIRQTLDQSSGEGSLINTAGDGSEFSGASNILGPAIQIGTNALSSHILAKNAEKRKRELLSGIDVNLGRISPQQIDLSRERANIKSQAAQTEAGGRYLARGARSASEAAKIASAARSSGQRASGQQLSQSLQREELENARLRAEANRMNLDLSNREKMMRLQQKQAIEQQYGDVPSQLAAQFAQTTGQSIGNYIGENQRMRRDYDYLQMMQPNMTMNYQQNFESLTPFQQKLARLGIRNVSPQISARP